MISFYLHEQNSCRSNASIGHGKLTFVDTAMDPKPDNESGNHPNEIIQLHVVVKNLQSIQTQTRFEDFMVEVDDADFDILLLTETWRSEREEFYKTNDGQNLFLSGSPLGHAGGGICVSKALSRDVLDVTFHAYSERLCALHLSFRHRKFQIFACYFPTSWAPDADVEGVYELLNLLLANCRQSGAIPIIGGDFNASIGEAQAGDDVNTFGNSGIGRRNARGQLLMQWVLENGLLVQNRLDHKLLGEDSWTGHVAGHLIHIWYRLILYLQVRNWLSWIHGVTSPFQLGWIIVVCIVCFN